MAIVPLLTTWPLYCLQMTPWTAGRVPVSCGGSGIACLLSLAAIRQPVDVMVASRPEQPNGERPLHFSNGRVSEFRFLHYHYSLQLLFTYSLFQSATSIFCVPLPLSQMFLVHFSIFIFFGGLGWQEFPTSTSF